MAGFSTDENRKVIPRWRTFDQTLRLGELDSVLPPRVQQQITADFLARKATDWLEYRTVGHAADFVGAALALGREGEAAGAARFLQDNPDVSPWARELGVRALGRVEDTEIVSSPKPLGQAVLRERVRTLRDLLRVEPRDPVTWVELSRTYIILGLREQAERTMTIALQLAMNSRFVLRAASRLWIVLDDPERAHDIISRADRTRYDPWLLSAEIAVGSVGEKTPRFTKSARQMLAGGQFSLGDISELASAVATLELGSGSTKKARRLFELSLDQPTENSIAQAAWASRQNRIIRLDHRYLSRPSTFEARSWHYYSESKWRQAIDECQSWLYDQPFSSKPGIHGSYVSGTALEDYPRSEQFAREGLIANPSDFSLLNNLTFALIKLGNLAEAKEALSRASRLQLSVRHQAVLQATQGLLAFRTGDVTGGRQLYADARAKARKVQDRRLLALASAFHAIEEASQNTPHRRSVRSEALQIVRQERDPIFRVVERRLDKLGESRSA